MMNLQKVAETYLAWLKRRGEPTDLDSEQGRIFWRTVLVYQRYIIREVLRSHNEALDERLYVLRLKKKMEENVPGGKVKFPLLENRLNELDKRIENTRAALIESGKTVMTALDAWQDCGATLEDLCLLCNRRSKDIRRDMGIANQEEWTLSKAMFICNVDFNYPKAGWIDSCLDAPFTHAVKEYMLDIMLHTPEGQKASHEAMEAVFPELMENALCLREDEEGVRHLYDKNGEIVADWSGEQ